MQISTRCQLPLSFFFVAFTFSAADYIFLRERDFLVDTLTLRAHIPLLLEVFTDSNIVKVFHGADMDIVWLQRDFGLYVVNMFDTGQAARVLGYPRYSLAYLLKHFCQVDADKQYQLADWRVRPLPEDMRRYAREDTHYLLYIYDCFKNELLLRSNESGNLLRAVWERSTSICLKKYEKSVWHEKKYQDLYLKYNRRYTKQQMSVFKALYDWRDQVSREEDESPSYILQNHLLFQIAEHLPDDKASLLRLCSPVPLHVKTHVNQLITIISRARKHINEEQLRLVSEEPLPAVGHSANKRDQFLPGMDLTDSLSPFGGRLGRCQPVFESGGEGSRVLALFHPLPEKAPFKGSVLVDILKGFQDPYALVDRLRYEGKDANIKKNNDSEVATLMANNGVKERQMQAKLEGDNLETNIMLAEQGNYFTKKKQKRRAPSVEPFDYARAVRIKGNALCKVDSGACNKRKPLIKANSVKMLKHFRKTSSKVIDVNVRGDKRQKTGGHETWPSQSKPQ
ncbi:uncharacterized protein LOC135146374 isoform X2 [Zophobas morio]|uniref:uncharacterized protein LOC135146374 isoform X2 n=1 Tax=Zophobas morio TaxID=2755281 RepID=UPI003083A4B4